MKPRIQPGQAWRSREGKGKELRVQSVSSDSPWANVVLMPAGGTHRTTMRAFELWDGYELKEEQGDDGD